MYAEIERLLSQIKCESGNDLLDARAPGSSAPAPASSTAVRTGIAAIDAALGSIAEDAPVIELLGTPASGKTQALYRVCICASLAASVSLDDGGTVDLGGCGLHTLFIDVDGKSDVRLLAHYMRAFVTSRLGNQGSAARVDEIVNMALDRIHVFAPSCTQSLIATLSLLPKYAADNGIEKSQCVLLVDGLGTHFWYDRRAANYMSLKSRRATPAFRLQQLFVDTLQEVRRHLGCVCFVTSILFLRHSGDLAAARSGSQESVGTDGQSSQGSSQMSQALGRMSRVVESGQGVFNDHMIPRWRSVVARSFVLEGAPVAGGQQRLHQQQLLQLPGTAVTFTEVGGSRSQQTAYVGPHGLQASP
ncbi:hypothetical protein LPJ53_000582 [Coemansia erecta]|uniref:DNA recombination and repair protein Rad51-like C-terminal domain-containing protein n=1 Tax=Coemansia erecta TaxID=147472 RepID=A0A9W7Y6T6_9FUNG|nr:hypothetical protein LPJ53_000582 [Coemansia erecta]